MIDFLVKYRSVMVGLVCLLLCGLVGCDRPSPDRVQGYVEGEFVYVASPFGGTLESLYVQRGGQVETGELLFVLDSTPEKAAYDEAKRQLQQARAMWEDARKGKRPSEIAALEAQLKQARASLTFSETQLAREAKLYRSGATAKENFDRARTARNRDRERVAQLEADLKTAKLGSRTDQIEAAEANLRAQEAALTRAEWNLAQKRQQAPQAGLVFDTLFREGEWVAAGRPVVALLPPQNIKVRAFISELKIGTIQVGDTMQVRVDGVPTPFPGRVSFISPRAEYTPPVIYSQESRAKLVFLIEMVFDPEIAGQLHPGQPVDVYLEP